MKSEWYVYQIQEFVRQEAQDITCTKPAVPISTSASADSACTVQ